MAGGLALLLSKGAPKGESEDEEKTEGDEEETKEGGIEDELLGDAFDALKSGDKMAFVEAMKNVLEK